LTFHELRHTFATLHLASGEKPKVIQEILGHSSIKTTMDTYSHMIPEMQEEAADRLQRLLLALLPSRSRQKRRTPRKTAEVGKKNLIFAGLLGARSAGLEPATF
jgi:Phage integrase family